MIGLDLEAARRCWEEEREVYKACGLRVVEVIREAIRLEGIPVIDVKYRVKDTDSLLQKMVRKGKAYEQIFDKIGVRVIAYYLDDLEPISRIVENLFPGAKSENMLDRMSEDQFGYLGIHVDITDRESDGKHCEVQIRTATQDAWSTMAHLLSYKGKEHVPKELRRHINRLSAVLEEADMGFNTIRSEIDRLPETEPLSILNHLERHFLRLIGVKHDRRLSEDIVLTLLPLLKNLPGGPQRFIDQFVWENRDRLSGLYHRYLNDYAYKRLFMYQPESIVIFALLEANPYGLSDAWEEKYPLEILQDMASIWGVALPCRG